MIDSIRMVKKGTWLYPIFIKKCLCLINIIIFLFYFNFCWITSIYNYINFKIKYQITENCFNNLETNDYTFIIFSSIYPI